MGFTRSTVKVWDIGVRLFHWSLVAMVTLTYFFDEPRKLHRGLGYVVIALIGFRLVWGLIGPRHARFVNFIPGPRRLTGYLADMLRARESRYLGHNPAGAVMILALLATLSAVGATGYMMGMDAYFGQAWVEDTHRLLVTLLLGLIACHIGGVIHASSRHRENLVLAMITGRKDAQEKGPMLWGQKQAIRRTLFLIATILQVGCGLVFAFDVLTELNDFTGFTWVELLGVLALMIGGTVTMGQYRELLHRNSKIELELGAASGAFQEVIKHHFEKWQLTEAECDVAILSIKGVSLSDIADMRQTRVGTIKSQCNAIYRKSGVSGRAELVAVMVEELIAGLEAMHLAADITLARGINPVQSNSHVINSAAAGNRRNAVT